MFYNKIFRPQRLLTVCDRSSSRRWRDRNATPSSLLIWLRKRSPSCSIFLKSFMKNAGRRAEVGGSRGAVTHALSHHPPFIPPSTPPTPPHPRPPSSTIACIPGCVSFFRERRGRGESYHGNSKPAESYLFAGLQRERNAKERLRDASRSFFKKIKKSLIYVQIQQNTKKQGGRDPVSFSKAHSSATQHLFVD